MAALRKSPIGNTTWVLMFGTACLYWLIGIIPGVDWLVDVVYLLTFTFWFWMHGIKFNSLSRIATLAISAIIEAIPVVSIIPAMPLAIIVMYFITRLPIKVTAMAGAVVGGTGGAGNAVKPNIPKPSQ